MYKHSPDTAPLAPSFPRWPVLVLALIGWGFVVDAATAPAPWPTSPVSIGAYRMAGDTVGFSIVWGAGALPEYSTEPESWEGQVWQSENDTVNKDGTLDTLVATFTANAPERSATATTTFTCGDDRFFGAYVRPVGSWDTLAAWGQSPPIELSCENLPPAPPTVGLDTIAIDTTTTPLPDTVQWEAFRLSDSTSVFISEDPDVQFTALGSWVDFCPYSYRDGVRAMVGPGLVGPNAVRGDPGVVELSPSEPPQCWRVLGTAVGNASIDFLPYDSIVQRLGG